MATVIAKYKFPNYEIRDKAFAQLRSKGFYYSECYTSLEYIEIYAECKNPQLAAQICIANGGALG